MAIDLPPAMPPQLATMEEIEQVRGGQQPVILQLNGFELRVTGDHRLSRQELRDIAGRAETPSQAIIFITAATNRRGHLLVTSYYAPQHNTVHVHALQGTVTEVGGDDAITGYFAGLEGNSELQRSDFDRARVMASIHSERTGVDYTVSYEADQRRQGDQALVFSGSPRAGHKSWDATLQLGNQGSRFAGRYIADVAAGYNFRNGTRVSAGYQRSFPDLGEALDVEDYHQFQLRADRPTRWGLYGLDASYVEYTQEAGPVAVDTTQCVGLDADGVPLLGGLLQSLGGLPLLGDLTDAVVSELECPSTITDTENVFLDLEAEVLRVGLSGEQVLASDVHYRFNLFQRLEYVDSQIKSVGRLQGTFQEEEYTALEAGARYQRIHRLGEGRLQWALRGSVKGGLSSDSGTLGGNDSSSGVGAFNRTAEFLMFKPEVLVRHMFSDHSSLDLRLRGQIADEQLPQQQQWVLGGIDTLSAYLPGVLVGDTGYLARGSYSHTWELGWATLTGSIFAEYGAVRYEDAGGDTTADGGRDFGSTSSVADAGIGLSLNFGERLELRAVAAESFHDKNVNQGLLDRTEADFYAVLKATF